MGTPNARHVTPQEGGRRGSDATRIGGARLALVRRCTPPEPVRRFPAIDARLVLRGAIRRYVVRRGRGPTEWFCEVCLGNTRVRSTATDSITEVVRCVEEYRREIEHLLQTGWRFQ